MLRQHNGSHHSHRLRRDDCQDCRHMLNNHVEGMSGVVVDAGHLWLLWAAARLESQSRKKGCAGGVVIARLNIFVFRNVRATANLSMTGAVALRMRRRQIESRFGPTARLYFLF